MCQGFPVRGLTNRMPCNDLPSPLVTPDGHQLRHFDHWDRAIPPIGANNIVITTWDATPRGEK